MQRPALTLPSSLVAFVAIAASVIGCGTAPPPKTDPVSVEQSRQAYEEMAKKERMKQ